MGEVRAESDSVDDRLRMAQNDAQPFLERRREFEALKAGVEPELVQTLEHLVNTHDDMKKREAEFKASCKQQLAHLRETLAKIRGGEGEEEAVFDEDADQDVAKLKSRMEKEREKASKLKSSLAK